MRHFPTQNICLYGPGGGNNPHAIDEYYFRRWGLGIATLIISIVGIALYLTIRKIEIKQQNKNNGIKEN